MKLLLKTAIQNRRHLFLLIITLFSMLFLTLASQTEMFALGVMAKSGPDVFTLFGKEKNGKLEQADQISLEEIQQRWNQIDSSVQGVITKEEANHYLALHQSKNLIQRVNAQIDKYLHVSQNLTHLAYLIVCVAIFKAATLFIHRYTTQLVAIRVSKDLRQRYFEHIQSLPMSFYQKHNIGGLSSRVVGDAGVVASAINSWLINYLQMPFTVISSFLACLWISWKLCMIIFIGFPLIIVPIVYLAKRIKRIAKQMQKNQEGFAAVLIDFLAGIQTVKVFAMEDFSLKKYREQNNRCAQLEEKSARYGLASRPILHTIASLFFATVILYGLYVLNMGVADILVFCGLLYVFYEPIKKFADENQQILRGIAAAERMYEVLDLKPTIQDEPDAESLNRFDNSIEFQNVSFRYGEEWVLKNLSFTVNKGETVAIVGPTGAGKSTIVQLLPRLYDVEEGEILIDGKPIKTFTQKSLRENIAFVPQKPFLFLDTIKENISFGKNFSHDEIITASKRAHAEEFIVQLPDQYNTVLAEAGKNLSGGQQQRLAIARALVKNAPILVMDEATSSLDAISENKIKQAILELHGSITQIIIAHRFSTIEHADKIIYLEKGKKVAEGTKEELLKSCTNFRLMWEMMHRQESESQASESQE